MGLWRYYCFQKVTKNAIHLTTIEGAIELLTLHTLWKCSHSLSIRPRQIAEFRGLYSKRYEPLLGNCSALKERSGRTVLHVSPSGNSNGTLLPVPREPPPLTANQVAELVRNYEESGE